MRNLLHVAVLLMGSLFAGCTSSVFAPIDSPNPWADDYSPLSSMENYQLWGTYNVHDPSCHKIGDYYYMYSTDAIFRENRKEAKEKGVPLGFIQMRRSKDLVNWEFLGWALPEIPQEAVEWVRSHAGGHGATNIWAPYIIPLIISIDCITACRLSDERHPISDWQNQIRPKALGRWPGVLLRQMIRQP